MREPYDIAIVTAWYPPEPAPFGHMMQELATFLVREGFVVNVFTSVPNHPYGAIYAGWRNRWQQCERPLPGLSVWRVGTLASNSDARRTPGKVSRVARFLIFTLLSFIALMTKPGPRVIFSVLQPLSVGPTLALAARVKRAKLVFNVQDLHPDAAVNLGLIRNRTLIGFLRRVEMSAYKRADAISVICDSFKRHCVSRGAIDAKVSVIPNWVDLDEIKPLPRPSELRQSLNLPQDAFVVLYAGTIGLVSGAEIVLEAASRLAQYSNIHFVFVGAGPLVARLQDDKETRRLSNVHFLPFQPRSHLNQVQALGDVSLVTLRPGLAHTSVPSKVLGYMAAARPVIAAVDADSETAAFIRGTNAGLVVGAGDVAGLGEAILRLRSDPQLAQSLGRAGRSYLEGNMTSEHVCAQYAKLFESQLQRAE